MNKFLILFFLTINLLSATISYAGSYKAQGQFYFDNGLGGGKATRTFKSSVVSEVPINLIMGDKTITLRYVIEPSPSINYSLTISISIKPELADEFSTTIFTKTYQSTLVGGSNGPFEFEEEQNGVKFGGVIGLNLRR